VLQKKHPTSSDPMTDVPTQLATKPLPPEQAEELLGEMGENWLYGSGLGTTVLNAGAIYLFPPFGLYVLGNSLLSMSGYEPLYVSKLLPDQEETQVNTLYDNVTSAPGRVSAALAGKEFRSREVIRHRLKKYQSDPTEEARGNFDPEAPNTISEEAHAASSPEPVE
jgi:hypothetical protein